MDDGTIFQYSIQRCVDNQIYCLATYSSCVPLCETNTTATYKIVQLSLKLHPQKYKGNHMPLYMDIHDESIFQHSIARCIGNTINNLVTFSRIVPFCATNTTTKYKICLNDLGIQL